MERVMRKKRGAPALLLGVLLLCVLVGGCSEKTETTLGDLLGEGMSEADRILITRIAGMESPEMTYLQEAADVERCKDTLREVQCRDNGKYQYEEYSGGTEIDLVFYQEKDGNLVKLAECSFSEQGELYYQGRKYTTDQSADLSAWF